MKKITLLTIMLLCGLYCIAQQSAESEISTIEVPKEAHKLNKAQTSEFLHKNFKHNEIQKFQDYKNSYNIDGIAIKISDVPDLTDENVSIERYKQMTDDFMKGGAIKILRSEIIKLNNIHFFIFQYEAYGERLLRFTSDFRNKKFVSCELNYQTQDEEKAQKILEKIMKTVRFKK